MSTRPAEPAEAASEPTGDPSSGMSGVGRHSMIYAIGILVSRGVSFLMLPIYTRYLTPADYGVLALVEMTLDFISILAGARLAIGVFRYYHKSETREEREEVVSTSFLLVSGMYALVGMGAFLGAEGLSNLVFGSDRNTVLFQIAAMNVAMGALSIIPMTLARVEDRSGLFVGVTMAKLAIQVGLVVLFLVGMGLGVLGVFLATLAANTLTGIFVTVWLYRSVRISWTGKAARDLLRYGIPLMLTNVATFATTFADRYVLQAVADESVVGLYSLAYQFGFILVMIGFGPIDQVWGPRRFRIATQSNPHPDLARGLVLINTVLVTLAVGISLFVGDLLRVLATPPFYPAATVVPVILLAYIMQSWASVVDIGILVREQTRFLAIANFIVAVVAVAGYLLFIPRYLAWGAAWMTLLAFVLQFSLTFVFSQRLWRVQYRWRPVLLFLGWGVVVASIGVFLPAMALIPSIVVRSVLGIVFLAGGWWLPILDAEDREMLAAFVRPLLARIRGGET